jgi:hypothetical protein
LKVLHQSEAIAAIWVFGRDNIEIIRVAIEFHIGERIHVPALIKARVFHESGGYKGVGDVRSAAVRFLLGAFIDLMPGTR